MSDHLKRGNMLWESSRMFLPEHKEQLLERKRRLKEFKPPLLDEDLLLQINHVLTKAYNLHLAITVTYTDKYGVSLFSGLVKQMKPHEKEIKLANDEGTMILHFNRILSAEIR